MTEINTIYNENCLETMKRMPDNSVDLVLTDPPYGVEWVSNRRSVKHVAIENDDNVDWIGEVYSELYRVLKPNSICISFYGWPEIDKFMAAWKAAGFTPKSHLVWVKNNFGLGWFTRGQHEPLFLLTKGKPVKPERAISDVLTYQGTGNELHPTQKPLKLFTQLIVTYSKEGDLIYDPFLGSGTTARACKDLGRKYIGSELSRKYCDIAEQRLGQEVLL